MAYLNWIKDEDLIGSVEFLLNVAKTAQLTSKKKFHKNVIDPFSAFFQLTGFEMDFNTWEISEQTRQSQKTLEGHIGTFHQSVLGKVNGWKDLETGGAMDIISDDRKILAEIKNKHNTVKGANLSDLYKSMESAIMPKTSRFHGFTAYYVTVIPKKPIRFDYPFTPSDKSVGKKLTINEKIRIIDGASFYELVTGERNALEKLFNVLPTVILNLKSTTISPSDFKNLESYFKTAFG